ncbi:hypothetical protein H4R33_005122 [Dimargaris cristalligena]|nr:hypothetical protein H4R33_005122 [Dimargaris cristalligena]
MAPSYTLDNDPAWLQFRAWLEQKQFPFTSITLAHFTGALRMWNKPKNASIKASIAAITTSEPVILALAIIQAKRQGSTSPLRPYIQVLPAHFSTVPLAHLSLTDPDRSHGLLAKLPADFRQLLQLQYERLVAGWQAAQRVWAIIAPQSPPLTPGEWKWAWLAVNTRCISLKTHSTGSNTASRHAVDTMAMAPMLDFLNHSNSTQVTTGFEPTLDAFVIRADHDIPKGQQAFINYGPHDNAAMLLEYGFTLPQNVYDSVALDESLLDNFFLSSYEPWSGPPGRALGWFHTWSTWCQTTLTNHGLWGDLTVKPGEISYRLVLTLLLLAQTPPIRRLPLTALSPGLRLLVGSRGGLSTTTTIPLDPIENETQLQAWLKSQERAWTAWRLSRMGDWVAPLRLVLDKCLVWLCKVEISRARDQLLQMHDLPEVADHICDIDYL